MFRTSWKDGILNVTSVSTVERVVAIRAGNYCTISKFSAGIISKRFKSPFASAEIITLRKGGPKTLYVKRCLKNCDEVMEWAKNCGFKSTLQPCDLHTTIAYSKIPVNWDHITVDPDEDLVVPRYPESKRVVKQFDGGATVLCFSSKALSRRWKSLCKNGCSWDFPDYEPHITLTYSKGDMDLSTMKPFKGQLHFGPEVHAEIDEGWKDGIVEQAIDGKGFYSIQPFHV